MEQLEKALSGLKNGKARDPNGLVNEIFKEGVAGKDLKLSLLTFLSRIRGGDFIPEFVELADVATIYKGKNDRGIFLVTIFKAF
jgi:hypothetical protein